ncbi:MAG TPA: chromosomal replication initiator protein DnaA [Pseudobdellovibrionaceae bacterium]|nr:chromosomal replication initiator protein DnaA [Pseudobdellovibrionaceae bacterium]
MDSNSRLNQQGAGQIPPELRMGNLASGQAVPQAGDQFSLMDQPMGKGREVPPSELVPHQTVETTSSTLERTSAIDAGFWRKVVDNLSAMNPENKLFRTWLSATSLDDLEPTESGVRFVIGVPSNLHKNFIEGYLDRFLPEIRAHYPGPFSIEIRVTNKTVAQEPTTVDEYLYQQEQQDFRSETRDEGLDQGANALGPKPAPSMNEPRPDMTFQTFVVGSTNEFAYTASRAIAEQPSSLYNPLFLVGPTGLGKTHLLFAIWNQLRASFPQLRVTYVAADRFLSEFLKHLRKNTAYEFQQKYREQCDVLLIDDIHILSRGERIQEEFFQTFNHFSLSRKQVVVTSDRLPRDIAGLEDRIRTRLEGGLIADIKMPDFETRLSILRSKAESKRLPIDEAVLQYIAKVSKRSVRELEGNLNKIEILVSLYNKPVTLESAKQVLALDAEGNQISMEDIEKLVADFYKLRVNDLRGSARPKPIVTARQVAMFLIKKNLPNKSLVEIGRHFGNRDHTTVMNSLERIQDQVQTNLDLKRDIDDLQGRIHNITGV